MHVANRSQALAGGAGALTVGALAVGALVAPFVAPNVEAPVVQAPVALSASPLNTIAGLITAGQFAAGGVIGSAGQANVIYPTDAITIGGGLVAQVQGLINNPSQIPAAIEHLPTQVELLTSTVEQQSTGVIASGQQGPAYTLPGVFVPFTRTSATGPTIDTVNNPATQGFVNAAATLDGITPAGLPKLATPITRGAQAVGTSLIQAQGLVRSAATTAVQGTFTAVASGNPGAVVNSFRTGADGVAKSVFGDPSVPKVTAGPITVGPVTIPAGLGADLSGFGIPGTTEPVKRLGAIRTVTQTTTNAIKGVAAAATP